MADDAYARLMASLDELERAIERMGRRYRWLSFAFGMLLGLLIVVVARG